MSKRGEKREGSKRILGQSEGISFLMADGRKSCSLAITSHYLPSHHITIHHHELPYITIEATVGLIFSFGVFYSFLFSILFFIWSFFMFMFVGFRCSFILMYFYRALPLSFFNLFYFSLDGFVQFPNHIIWFCYIFSLRRCIISSFFSSTSFYPFGLKYSVKREIRNWDSKYFKIL